MRWVEEDTMIFGLGFWKTRLRSNPKRIWKHLNLFFKHKRYATAWMQQTIKLSCKNFRNPLFPTIQNVDNITKVGTFYKIVKSLVLFLVFSSHIPKSYFGVWQVSLRVLVLTEPAKLVPELYQRWPTATLAMYARVRVRNTPLAEL
jgi:hypothetical protein